MRNLADAIEYQAEYQSNRARSRYHYDRKRYGLACRPYSFLVWRDANPGVAVAP